MPHLWNPSIYQCLCHPILWKSDAGTTARVAPDPMQLLPIDSWLVGLYEVVYWAGHCIPMIFSFLLLILQFHFLSLIVVIMSYSDFQSVYYIYTYWYHCCYCYYLSNTNQCDTLWRGVTEDFGHWTQSNPAVVYCLVSTFWQPTQQEAQSVMAFGWPENGSSWGHGSSTTFFTLPKLEVPWGTCARSM